ncbi:hypothetical protein, partial [Escherichia coli]|uniref:hypothetical protein n=1 Tax=Escherichia coli TaxID=562 RepID=UPI001C5995A9
CSLRIGFDEKEEIWIILEYSGRREHLVQKREHLVQKREHLLPGDPLMGFLSNPNFATLSLGQPLWAFK